MNTYKDFPKHWTDANVTAFLDAQDRDLMVWPCHGCMLKDVNVPHTHNCSKRDKKLDSHHKSSLLAVPSHSCLGDIMNTNSCQGCGWSIRNDLADDGAERIHYCRICDPTAKREAIRDMAERETRPVMESTP